MTRLFLYLALACWLAGPLVLARAEKADSTQPMNIEADALRYDEARQISVFSGRVVATKGSIVLRGARLQVRQDAQGFMHGVLTGTAQERAFFRQRLDVRPGQLPEAVEGEGEIIEYDGRSETVHFKRRSELRRYRGGQLGDAITGSAIVYNRLSDVFTVDGQQASGGLPSATPGAQGRVRAVIAPRAGALADAAATQPPPDAPLRPSPRLDSLEPR